MAKVFAAAIAAVVTLPIGNALGQTPQRGGVLTIANSPVLPTLDCHALNSANNLVSLAPAYSTLLRFDPDKYPEIVGDLAQSWIVSPDRLTYTFKVVPNVRFHDGSALTSADVKASYDRMRAPPAGVVSIRQGRLSAIASIETPDAATVVFKLSKPNPAMLLNFASPYGCIYSAAKLAENPKYPEITVMGTGPFKFVEFVPGSSMTLARSDNYFRAGLPYLDGIKLIYMSTQGIVTAMSGGQTDAALSQVSPAGIKLMKAARGDRLTFPEGPYNVTNMVEINNKKSPLNDVRVRRALNLALDRRTGDAMMQVTTQSKGFGAFFAANVALDMTDEELHKLPGFGPDMAANRAEARKLLAEAGVPNLKLTLLNRNTGEPYTTLGIFVIDQLRQVGVTVEQRLVDTAPYFAGLSGLNFDIAISANITTSSDPTEVLTKFLPNDNQNFTGAHDPVLQELYDKQAVEEDFATRRKLVIEFQKRIIDQAYLLPMFRTTLYAALSTNVKGWKLLPSTLLNVDMRQVWLQK